MSQAIYDVDRANRYLGPADYNTPCRNACMRFYTEVVTSIAMTILRIINFIFGDHRWYNNEIGLRLATAYYMSPFDSAMRADARTTAAIEKLVAGLRQRRYDRVSSYADHIQRRLPEPSATSEELTPVASVSNELQAPSNGISQPYFPMWDASIPLLNEDVINQRLHPLRSSQEGALPSQVRPHGMVVVGDNIQFKLGRMGNRTIYEVAKNVHEFAKVTNASDEADHILVFDDDVDEHVMAEQANLLSKQLPYPSSAIVVRQFGDIVEGAHQQPSMQERAARPEQQSTGAEESQERRNGIGNGGDASSTSASTSQQASQAQRLADFLARQRAAMRARVAAMGLVAEHSPSTVQAEGPAPQPSISAVETSDTQEPQPGGVHNARVLLRKAIHEAWRSLRDDGLNHQRDLSSSMRQWVCRRAIYQLLSNAEDVAVACTAHRALNINKDNVGDVYISYDYDQQIAYPANSDVGPQTTSIYLRKKFDVLSKGLHNCDPELAFHLLKKWEHSSEYVIKDILNAEAIFDYPEEIQELHRLVSQMANSLADQWDDLSVTGHGSRLDDFAGNDPVFAPIDARLPFSTQLGGLRTAEQLVQRALLYVSQRLANQGLITRRDILSPAHPAFHTYLVRAALFEVFALSQSPDDFTLRLPNNITVPCGKRYYYMAEPKPLDADDTWRPTKLVVTEWTEGNLFCPGGTDIDRSVTYDANGNVRFAGIDPIFLSTLMNKLGSQGRDLLAEDLFAEREVDLYQARGGNDPDTLNRPSHIREKVAALPEEAKKQLEEIKAQLSSMTSLFLTHDGKLSPGMMYDLVPYVQVQSGLQPIARSHRQETFQDMPVASVAKDVEWNYVLPALIRHNVLEAGSSVATAAALIKIKSLPQSPLLRMTPTRKITENDYCNVIDRSPALQTLLQKQFRIGDSVDHSGDCMYGAIAACLIGQDPSIALLSLDEREGRELPRYKNIIKALREMTAEYLNDHPEQYGFSKATARDLQQLNQQLRSIRGGDFGTELEQRILADIFGVRIEVYTSVTNQRCCQLDAEGHIMPIPSMIRGAQYRGEPIRIYYYHDAYFGHNLPIWPLTEVEARAREEIQVRRFYW